MSVYGITSFSILLSGGTVLDTRDLVESERRKKVRNELMKVVAELPDVFELRGISLHTRKLVDI